MHINENRLSFLAEPPRRLTRKQSVKWTGAKETPKQLRHVGGGYTAFREVELTPSRDPSTRH